VVSYHGWSDNYYLMYVTYPLGNIVVRA
jgi:hypothetical protein